MLFNKQNRKQVDPRYFLKESILNEAPTDKQVSKLSAALTQLFGANCEVGQGSEGHASYITIKDQEGKFHNFTPVSAAYTKSDMQPAMYRKGASDAKQGAYVLLQNAEQMERVMQPVINKIYKMAGAKKGPEDKYEDTGAAAPSSALDQQEELAKLKREHEQLKRDFNELKSMVLKMMAGESSEAPVGRSLPKIPTPARSTSPRSTGPSLEIDQ